MKIKQDFITNSSSTMFVVCIPSDFYPDQERIINLFNQHASDYDHDDGNELDWEETRILSDFEECLEILKSGDNLWLYGNEGCSIGSYNAMIDICSENNFLLATFDANSEGNNRIQGINEEEIKKWFMNTQLQKMTLEVPDEQN